MLFHVVAASAGLPALLLASFAAFSLVKLAGALYLIYLGLRAITSASVLGSVAALPKESLTRVFVDGVVVSALNPKIAIFFIVFLPQIVDPDASSSVSLQVMVLGLLYALLAVLTDGAYALLATRVGSWLSVQMVGTSFPQYVSGAVFTGLGIGTALVGRR